MSYLTTLLNAQHKKATFSCGKESLDIYIQKQATQDIKRKLAVCFVLPEKETIIKGYYTLSNDNVAQELLPEDIKKKMPKNYVHLPTTLLGRLAADINYKGQGIGEMLLLDALRRCYDVSTMDIGSMAVIADPLDQDAKFFYLEYGFIELPGSGRMFLPMKTIGLLFRDH